MSQTVVGTPDKFSPVYNPIFFYIDSSNKTNEGFKYVVDIFSANTATRIGRYKLFPRPIDGYGVVDVNQLLSSQVSYYVNQDHNTISATTSQYIDYDVKYGEEYVFYWQFASNTGTTGTYAGYTTLFSVNTHNYVAGDSVLVAQNAGFTYPQYNGVHTVLSASTNALVINAPYQGVSPNNAGSVVYADKHKTLYTGITSSTAYTAYNAVIGHQDYMTYAGSAYTFGLATTGKFLTNAPANYKVKTSNKIWLNYHTNTLGESYKAVITTRYGTYDLYSTVLANKSILTIGCGPANITAVELQIGNLGLPQWSAQTGTNPVFKNVCWDYDYVSSSLGGFTNLNSNTTQSPWYTAYTNEFISVQTSTGQTEIEIINTSFPNTITLNIPYTAFTGSDSGTVFQQTDYYTLNFIGSIPVISSEVKRFDVDYTSTRYGNIEVYFIDRLGSLIPVNFELVSVRTLDIERNEYQTSLGDLTGNKWGYESTDRGRNILNTTIKHQIILNSKFIDENTSTYMAEFVSSPVHYIKENGKLWPVIMKTNNYAKLTKLNRKNIPFQVTIEYANNDRVQNF